MNNSSLTTAEIDRYSRQIIVAGGIAQERLRAARILIAGDADNVGPVLDYLAGAGVGRISLRLTGDGASNDRSMACAREINPDVTIDDEATHPREDAALQLVIIGSTQSLALAADLIAGKRGSPIIIAHLAPPARIVILPAPIRELDPLDVFPRRDDNANFVAMVAATEVVKLLIGERPAPEPSTIHFDGYQTRILRG